MKDLINFKLDSDETQVEYSVVSLIDEKLSNQRAIIEESLSDINSRISNVQNLIDKSIRILTN
ncbi:hypothetical protein [uncultured Phocaeicola sp.]|mgnify:CR=1 FL=1|jgi:hypothetical protein|uniref:hypothetical protein n=1 Tax=uncultured Phocaeicola sp. TaxID=990718 RepID=UPI00258C5F16|nr:hypothetical protein [uncultured Phocaeicola sp.]